MRVLWMFMALKRMQIISFPDDEELCFVLAEYLRHEL